METEPEAGLPAGVVYRVQVRMQMQAQVGDRHGADTSLQTHPREHDRKHTHEEAPAFDAPAGVALLASALRAGVMLDSSCRNGTCRTCMLRLLEGRVRYQVEWPGLLAEEKAEGWILPCVACPETDLVLALPN